MTRRRRPSRYMKRPEGIDDVLTRTAETRFAKTRPPISARLWAQIVGGRIAGRAEPVRVDHGALVVKVATSVWASELSLLSEAILERLRTAGIDVKRLQFRVGEISPPDRPPERRRTKQVPPPAPLPPDLSQEIARVEDPELRAVLAESARRNLAWQLHTAPAAPTGGPRAARVPPGAGRGSAPPGRSSGGTA